MSRVYWVVTDYRRFLVAWAPALTHLGATLEGLHTIKALKAQEHCSREYGMHYNYGTSTWNMGVGLHCWYKIRTNLIVCAYSATIVVACLLARNSESYLSCLW